MTEFTTAGLRADGFEGFTPLIALDPLTVPRTGGVYAVLTTNAEMPAVLDRNCGGHFKGKDPTVSTSILASRWVADTDVIYIGKADELRRRLRQFRDFGQGKPVGHWGGRFVWQLADSSQHVVCWKPTAEDPRSTEVALLNDFRAAHGQNPYANIAS